MAKVKKRAGLTGVRNVVKGKAKRPSATRPVKKAKPRATPAGARSRSDRREAVPKPVIRVTVRELDPQRKCGAGTSVQLLYRVDETVDGRATAHLVFFDRHGWYCEHGRTCPAVAHARKQGGRIARVS